MTGEIEFQTYFSIKSLMYSTIIEILNTYKYILRLYHV